MTGLIVVVAVLLAMVGLTPCTEGKKSMCPKVFSYPNPCTPKLNCQTDLDCTTFESNKSCCPADLSCNLVCRKPHVSPIDENPLNLILVMEGARHGFFKQIKTLAKRLIDHFDISHEGTHVAILAYDGNDKNDGKYFRILVNFGDSTCPGDLNAVNIKLKIDNLNSTFSADVTLLNQPFEKVRDEIITKIPDERKQYKTVLVLIGSNFYFDTPIQKLRTIKREMNAEGVNIFASCLYKGNKWPEKRGRLRELTSSNRIFLSNDNQYYKVFKAVKDEQQNLHKAKCSPLPLDLILLIDQSIDIDGNDRKKIVGLASYLTTSFVHAKYTRIAVIIFGDGSEFMFNSFNRNGNKNKDVEVKLKDVLYKNGDSQTSNIDRVLLDLAKDKIPHQKVFEHDYKSLKVCLVFTNGKQTIKPGKTKPLDQASAPLKRNGFKIFALGFGKNQDKSNLRLIASPGSKYVPKPESYDFLDIVIDGLQPKCDPKQKTKDVSEQEGSESDENENNEEENDSQNVEI